jgi:amino acid adenylation domain-containing protein
MNAMPKSGDTQGHGQTVVHLLREKVQREGERIIYSYLEDGERLTDRLTYAGLDARARAIACTLRDMGAAGERAVLIYPAGLDYIGVFFGCLYSGVIAVPVYPPDPARLEQTLPKLLGVVADSGASLVLTTAAVAGLAGALAASAPQLAALRWVPTDRIPEEAGAGWAGIDPHPEDLAYLQYTSGSTRLPRGVRLTHRNLMHNSQSIRRSFHVNNDDVGVLWLPMYHNLGLLGAILQPFYSGITCILMQPQAFLERPVRWLRAITQYRGTLAGCPNFGFDLAVQRVTPAEREGLDLSSWSLAFNGAEPVRPETVARFTAAYAPYGFHPEAFYPCYGLAEATLMVTGGVRGGGVTLRPVARKALEEHRVQPAGADASQVETLVSCGQPFPDQPLTIVHPETCLPVASGEVGELWLAGPSVADGYWNRPAESAETFQGRLAGGEGPFLRTGDLGFLADGECFITGRLKDLIIIRGRNHYPQDIEATVSLLHPALVASGGAAFSIDLDGEERLVVAQEVDPRAGADLDELARRIRQAVSEQHELQVYALALVPPGSLPRTASGKIQRHAVRKAFSEGALQLMYQSSLAQPKTQPAPDAQPQTGGQASLIQVALQALGPARGQDLVQGLLRDKVAQVLHLPVAEIDPSEPLTALGLDSIAAVELVEDGEAALGIPLPVEMLLRGASLEQLSAALFERLTRPAAAPAPAPVTPPAAAPSADQPLSSGQKALWFQQRLVSGSVAHNIVYAARIRPAAEIRAFRSAFQKIVERHAVLRTTFHEVDGQPVARVSEMPTFGWTIEDARGWSADQLDERLSAEVNRPFDLEKGPLLRVTVLHEADDSLVVALALHHIVTDLWSMAILLHELGELYDAEIERRAAGLRPPAGTYAEYVRRQTDLVGGLAGADLRAYWAERLAGDLPALALPTDRPRPAAPTGRGAALTARLGPDLTAALKGLAERTGATLFTALLAAFDVLLYRYTGQTDLLVATPKAGRTRQDAETMGYFINPLVLRADLSGDPDFTGLLERVSRTTRADFEHDAYPYPRLVEDLRPGGGSLFNVFYSWQKTTRLVERAGITAFALNTPGELRTGSLNLVSLPLRSRVTPTDLALMVAETDDDLALTVEYSTELFDEGTVQRMLGHLRTLIEGIAADPAQQISRLPLLTPAERRQILDEWSGAGAAQAGETAGNSWVWEEIARQARAHPAAPALSSAGQSLTYAELAGRVEALAGRVHAAGLAPQAVVGVCLERSLESIVSLLAVLRAGGVYLPLDPDYPSERLAFLLADSGAGVALTQSKLLTRLPDGPAQRICLDEPAPEASAPEWVPTAEDLAYILYTSGSTGQPKGVCVSHQALARHCHAMCSYYRLTPADRVLQFASPSFDAALEQVFTALMAGACLVLRDVDLWDPGAFSAKIAELKLTEVNIPPVYWQEWTRAEASAAAQAPSAQLHLVILGGDVVSPHTLAEWRRTPLNAVRLINAYGPTEALITACAYDIPPDLEIPNAERVPIGRPLGGRRAYILEPGGEPVPAGVPGELCLGGACLAQGYLNQPALTAEKFVPDPFRGVEEPGARMYRTGDLARWRADGQIEFLGRADRQIKLRGMRIELEEIERALLRLPGVAEAAVALRPGDLGESLVACVVPAAGSQPDAAELAAGLARQLPAYMVPGVYLPLETLPLTPGGKVDRQAIRRLAQAAAAGTRPSDTPPRSPLEAQIAAVWQDLLGVPRVGIHDNFFALGGHSLLATQLVSRLRQAFEVDLPLAEVFDRPTVAGLALAVTQALAGQEAGGELDALLEEIEALPESEIGRENRDE